MQGPAHRALISRCVADDIGSRLHRLGQRPPHWLTLCRPRPRPRSLARPGSCPGRNSRSAARSRPTGWSARPQAGRRTTAAGNDHRALREPRQPWSCGSPRSSPAAGRVGSQAPAHERPLPIAQDRHSGLRSPDCGRMMYGLDDRLHCGHAEPHGSLPSWCPRCGSAAAVSRPALHSPARGGPRRPGRSWPWRTAWVCGRRNTGRSTVPARAPTPGGWRWRRPWLETA
jgi:hypothetical protein